MSRTAASNSKLKKPLADRYPVILDGGGGGRGSHDNDDDDGADDANRDHDRGMLSLEIDNV